MGVSSPTNSVALAEPTRPARFHVSASHRPPPTCHPSPESVHYPSKPRNPIPNAPRLPRPPPLAASSMSPLPRVLPLPAIPLLTAHPFAFTLSNLTAHFSSLTPLAPVIPARCLPRACRGAGTQRQPSLPPQPATPFTLHPEIPKPPIPPAHGEPVEPHPVHAKRPELAIPPSPSPPHGPVHYTRQSANSTGSHRRPKIARKAPPGASRVFWKKLLPRARPPIHHPQKPPARKHPTTPVAPLPPSPCGRRLEPAPDAIRG